MSLGKIFGLYTVCFLGVTILIGLAEIFLGLSPQWIGWIFMGLSLGIYIVIGIITRTSNPDQYYVAGRGVPAVLTAWPRARTGCPRRRLFRWPARFPPKDSPALRM